MSIVVKIHRDESPQDPRDDDNVGTMACWHDRYNLGDVQPKCEPTEWLEANAPEGSIVLALYLYDHSGITMSCESFDCPWDSGQVGVIVVTPEKIRYEWGEGDQARVLAESYLRGEVQHYDHFLTGTVYGYTIEHPQPCGEGGQEKGPEDIDSCWGFFGDCLADMKDHVDEQYHAALTQAWEDR